MMTGDILKKDNETDFEYHKRLVKGKLVDKTLADYDYSELSYYLYGQEYSSDVARRMMYGSNKTVDIISGEIESIIRNASDNSVISSIDEKIIEMKKERQRLFDQRSAYSKVVRDMSRREEMIDIIKRAIADTVSSSDNSVYDANAQIIKENPVNMSGGTDLLISLNDIHYGAFIDNAWNKYNSDICKWMFDEYLNKIAEIASTHGSENCICWMNGDAISGNIHYSIAVTNKENVIEQVIGVSELISNFLAKLSRMFKTVRFVSVAGNHSRINPNKDKSMITERMDDLIEWYVSARLQNFSNILFDYTKIDSTMYAVNIRGKVYCGVHGDYDMSESKLQTLVAMVGEPVHAVLMGHMHHNKVETVNGVKIVMSGSFLGMDDYCVQKRLLGKPEQIVCVCDENGIRCTYDIRF